MDPQWLWLGAAIAGYLLVLGCSPLRGFVVDGFDMLRGRGGTRLWLPLAVFSLVPVSFGWFGADAVDDAASARPSRRAMEVMNAASADAASMFTCAAGLRPAAGARELPAKTRAALSIGVVFWSAWMIGLQFFILVALYLGAIMPERDPGWKGLIDFAWRRLLRFWPGIFATALFPILALWLPDDGAAAVCLWPLAALAAAVFAFLQVSLLSGERGLRDALGSNFSCWRKLPYDAFWFLVLIGVHVFLLRVADAAMAGWLAGKPLPSRLWDVVFATVRAAVLVWLLASWVLLFCAKTKNPSRRRIRP